MAAVAAGADAGAGTPSTPVYTPSARQPPPVAAEAAAGGAGQVSAAPAAVGDFVAGNDDAPREDDLREYAESLGVDMDREMDLLWVVEESFHAPLPSSWTEHTDDEGRCYFFHEASNQSTWEHPTDAVYRELLGLVQHIRSDVAGLQQRAVCVHDHLRQVHQRAMQAIEGWSGPYSSEVGEYFYNEALKVSTWENPVSEWENELLIRHTVLCRCLLPEHTTISSDGSICAAGGESSLAGAAGINLLQALQLPLGQVRPTDTADQPQTPSTTRSIHTYHTARSMLSTRSIHSGTSADKHSRREKRGEGHKSPKDSGRRRNESSRSAASASVSDGRPLPSSPEMTPEELAEVEPPAGEPPC
eukprot:TRINITY_DN123189_c0_g1_i1.p1 TRINITY_DN123189_c0_g1~~TRINITY_DN123189_c0_g1_i1.p1  ORF type:complete len:359 (-),score=59.95 TRINITY_DN123189_c0_g1_i1:189-1265(-)